MIPTPLPENRRRQLHTRRTGLLIAVACAASALGFGVAALPRLSGRVPELGRWNQFDSVLLVAVSAAILVLAFYLHEQQRRARALRKQLQEMHEVDLERAKEYAQKIESANEELRIEIAERVWAQEQLLMLNETLEQRVAERSAAAEQRAHELREAKMSLEERNRHLFQLYKTGQEFVDNVSHEFRTPLTVIKEYVSTLRDGETGEMSAEQTEYLDIVIRRVDDLSIMVNDMLDIGRIESGNFRMSRRLSRVAEIIGDIRTTLERKASDGNVSIEIALDDLPTVYCDPEKVARAIINLAVNAVKFSDEGGRVKLWARHDAEGSQVRIGIVDHGAGIAPENLRTIFERFTQVGRDIRASSKGFGLGLNIVRELVHLNYGDISVQSQVGAGSTFSFTVPTAEPAKLMARYLKRVEYFRGGSTFVSLVSASVDPAVRPLLLDDVEQFLEDQIRRSDLLFRTQPASWLLVIALSQEGLDEFVGRLHDAHLEANGVRPLEPLPAIDLNVRGTWPIRAGRDEFIDSFEAEYQPTEILHTGAEDEDGDRLEQLALRNRPKIPPWS